MDESVNICRICLAEKGEFQSLFFSDKTTGTRFAEMIMSYASVQIALGDGLPSQICLPCTNKVLEMYMFKKLCEASDISLRAKLGRSPLLKVYIDADGDYTPDFSIDVKDAEILIKPEVCNNIINIEESKKNNGSGEQIRVIDNNIPLPECVVQECEQVCDILKPFHCNICPKVFAKKSTLQKHKLTHSTKAEDEKISDSDVNVLVSIDEESEEKPMLRTPTFEGFKGVKSPNKRKDKPDLECFICTRKFTKPSHLTRHLKIHNPVKPHACKICYKRYSRHEQLTAHMNIHMGVKPHVCEICLKGFNQISNLKDHMRTHNGEKPFLCSTCGKGFNQLGNLRQHTIRHSGIKAHVCTFCGHGFASKGELGAHLRKHTGARPFVCAICNHGFTTSSSLTKHKRIHSGEKPYECDVCHMRFSRSGILVRHKRIHTGEKPYVCKYCSKAFTQSNDLSSHLRIHTGEKPYICDICGSAFRQNSALKTHKKTHVDRNVILESKVMLGMMQQTVVGNL